MSKCSFTTRKVMQNCSLVGVPFRAKLEMLCKRCECVCESEREETGEGEGMFLRAAKFHSLRAKQCQIQCSKGCLHERNGTSKMFLHYAQDNSKFEFGEGPFQLLENRLFWLGIVMLKLGKLKTCKSKQQQYVIFRIQSSFLLLFNVFRIVCKFRNHLEHSQEQNRGKMYCFRRKQQSNP